MVRALLLALLLAALPAVADAPRREFIYGGQLMKKKEREQYRKDFASAPDDAARERLRAEHRARMDERAKKRGFRLDKSGVAHIFR